MAFMETSGRDHTTQHVDKAKPYKENPISQSSLGPVVQFGIYYTEYFKRIEMRKTYLKKGSH